MTCIESISPVNLIHVTMSKDYANKIGEIWTEWRTTQSGDYWECLMGMSWEETDPPQEFIDEFKRLHGVL